MFCLALFGPVIASYSSKALGAPLNPVLTMDIGSALGGLRAGSWQPVFRQVARPVRVGLSFVFAFVFFGTGMTMSFSGCLAGGSGQL